MSLHGEEKELSSKHDEIVDLTITLMWSAGMMPISPSPNQPTHGPTTNYYQNTNNIPQAYHDLTVCLHDRFYAVRKGKVEEIWQIDARGRLD